jgi:hypothetical protein
MSAILLRRCLRHCGRKSFTCYAKVSISRAFQSSLRNCNFTPFSLATYILMNHVSPSGLNCYTDDFLCDLNRNVHACCTSITPAQVRLTTFIILELCHNKYAIQIGLGCTKVWSGIQVIRPLAQCIGCFRLLPKNIWFWVRAKIICLLEWWFDVMMLYLHRIVHAYSLVKLWQRDLIDLIIYFKVEISADSRLFHGPSTSSDRGGASFLGRNGYRPEWVRNDRSFRLFNMSKSYSVDVSHPAATLSSPLQT